MKTLFHIFLLVRIKYTYWICLLRGNSLRIYCGETISYGINREKMNFNYVYCTGIKLECKINDTIAVNYLNRHENGFVIFFSFN